MDPVEEHMERVSNYEKWPSLKRHMKRNNSFDKIDSKIPFLLQTLIWIEMQISGENLWIWIEMQISGENLWIWIDPPTPSIVKTLKLFPLSELTAQFR